MFVWMYVLNLFLLIVSLSFKSSNRNANCIRLVVFVNWNVLSMIMNLWKFMYLFLFVLINENNWLKNMFCFSLNVFANLDFWIFLFLFEFVFLNNWYDWIRFCLFVGLSFRFFCSMCDMCWVLSEWLEYRFMVNYVGGLWLGLVCLWGVFVWGCVVCVVNEMRWDDVWWWSVWFYLCVCVMWEGVLVSDVGWVWWC